MSLLRIGFWPVPTLSLHFSCSRTVRLRVIDTQRFIFPFRSRRREGGKIDVFLTSSFPYIHEEKKTSFPRDVCRGRSCCEQVAPSFLPLFAFSLFREEWAKEQKLIFLFFFISRKSSILLFSCEVRFSSHTSSPKKEDRSKKGKHFAHPFFGQKKTKHTMRIFISVPSSS